MNMKKRMRYSSALNRTILSRTLMLMFTLGGVIFVVLMVYFYRVQIVGNAVFKKAAINQQTLEITITPLRGGIYDRNYKPLAVSDSAETVFISPAQIDRDKGQDMVIAQVLSDILEVDYDSLYIKTQKVGRYYEIVRKRIEKEQSDQIRAFVMDNELQHAVYIIPDYKRYYPNGNFLSSVLGFVGEDNQGLYGIESIYEEELKGVPGSIVIAKDGWGKAIPYQYETYNDVEDGNNIVLTIDATIQSFVEKHLKTAVTESKVGQRAAAIVMDVNSGEILAMDTQNSYDPNQPWELIDEQARASIENLTGEEKTEKLMDLLYTQWRNKAVVDTYEPGATFNIITAAIALEEKVVSFDNQFYCDEQGDYGTKTFTQGVQSMCNSVFVEIAQRVGTDKYYKHFIDFGFTEKTGIDMTSESAGVYAPWEDFNNLDTLSSYSVGQTFSITPIQLITAVSAVANGGHLMRPHLVREFTDSDNNIIKTVEPVVIRDVISDKTSSQLCEILETVVSVGSGKNAYLEGYRIAGMSGVSQKYDPQNPIEYMPGKYIVSFIAFAPADNPQVALLVLLDEPMVSSLDSNIGDNMAAPIVRHIMADILPYLQGVMR